MTPSEVFSATVSTAALITCVSVKFCVSLPTSMAIWRRPASRPSRCRAVTTFLDSAMRHRAAKHCQQRKALRTK